MRALALLAICAALAWPLRRTLLRLFLRGVLHAVYRIRVHAPENLPPGGALLVANHLSYVDALLVGAALRRRVLFLMHRSFFEVPVVGRFAELFDTIPVASGDTPEAKAESLGAAARRAAAGELVCIFSEGAISRSGVLLPFARGLETIAREARVPIVPVSLDRVWGSLFSFSGGRVFWKRPQRLPYPIDVRIGAPLPFDTPAWRVRELVQEGTSRLREERAPRTRSLAYRFLRSARRHARRAAVSDTTGVELSYRRLLWRSLALSTLLERVCGPSERVAVLLPPGAGGAVTHVALALAGRTVVPLNYTLSNADLARLAGRAGAGFLVTSRRFLEVLQRESPLDPARTLFLEDLAACVSRADRARAFLLALLPGPLLARLCDPITDGRAPAAVIFSSGSSGEPKGVLLSHSNIASNVLSVAQLFAFGREDRILGVLPFFHAFGLTATLWTPLCGGGSVVYHGNPLDAKTIGELARRTRPTILMGTPTFFRAWLERCGPADFASLRLCVSGAEKLPLPLVEAWAARFGHELYEGYGCTEMSPVVAINVPEYVHAIHSDWQPLARRGTVGRALPGVALRIVDAESGESLPPESEGLLQVRGPNRMLGYLDDPERTRAALRDGWYVTGDIAKLDRHAFLTITDRQARFSKIGGEMVSHGRVEEALIAALGRARSGDGGAPSVDLAVTSVEDERRGERLVVLHTKLPCARERWLEELARGELPSLFRPRGDAFVEVEAIPHLGSGKLDLVAARELARSAIVR